MYSNDLLSNKSFYNEILSLEIHLKGIQGLHIQSKLSSYKFRVYYMQYSTK